MTEALPDRPYRGRRISWAEFYAQRPDLRPANDNLVDRKEYLVKRDAQSCSR
jgi:hypothetical protein